MPGRSIERKGIIFDKIAEKGDTAQVTKLQKENRQLTEKVEALEGEYKKLRKTLEFVMELVDAVAEEDLKNHLFTNNDHRIIHIN